MSTVTSSPSTKSKCDAIWLKWRHLTCSRDSLRYFKVFSRHSARDVRDIKQNVFSVMIWCGSTRLWCRSSAAVHLILHGSRSGRYVISCWPGITSAASKLHVSKSHQHYTYRILPMLQVIMLTANIFRKSLGVLLSRGDAINLWQLIHVRTCKYFLNELVIPRPMVMDTQFTQSACGTAQVPNGLRLLGTL